MHPDNNRVTITSSKFIKTNAETKHKKAKQKDDSVRGLKAAIGRQRTKLHQIILCNYLIKLFLYFQQKREWH